MFKNMNDSDIRIYKLRDYMGKRGFMPEFIEYYFNLCLDREFGKDFGLPSDRADRKWESAFSKWNVNKEYSRWKIQHSIPPQRGG